MWAVFGEGLKILASLLEHGTPEAIDAAKALAAKLHGAFEGHATAQDIRAELDTLRARLSANDAEAVAALHARFDTGG